MHALRSPLATSLLFGALLILPFSSSADEDLAAKRALCQTEARQRIKPLTRARLICSRSQWKADRPMSGNVWPVLRLPLSAQAR